MPPAAAAEAAAEGGGGSRTGAATADAGCVDLVLPAEKLPTPLGPSRSASFRDAVGKRTGAATADAGFICVDLGLPADKLPTLPGPSRNIAFKDAVGELWAPGSQSMHKFRSEGEDDDDDDIFRAGPKKPARPPPPEVTPAVGTADVVRVAGDTGLFGTVFEAWSHHAALRTSPEDWWCVLITRVATVIDAAADRPEVKALFVPNAKGKELLSVSVDCPQGIYSDVYESLFSGFSMAIAQKIAVPGYAEAVTADFSTTSPVQRLGSQITLMTSFQKYFDYRMMVFGCGLAAVEMRGSAADWARLGTKLAALRQLLAPAEHALHLSAMFSIAERVYENLHRTFVDGESMRPWWAKVLFDDMDIKYGPSGMRQGQVEAYNGWLVGFMLGEENAKLKAQELARGKYSKQLTCLSSTPMQIVDTRMQPNLTDNSIVAAGILGHKMHKRAGGSVALEPAHGWVLMLPAKSPLCRG